MPEKEDVIQTFKYRLIDRFLGMKSEPYATQEELLIHIDGIVDIIREEE